MNQETKTTDWRVAVKAASRALNLIGEAKKNEVLEALAERIASHKSEILEANVKDLSRMDPENPMYDRLLLNEKRLEDIANDMRKGCLAAKSAGPRS